MSVRREYGRGSEGEWVRTRPHPRLHHEPHDDDGGTAYFGIGTIQTLSEQHDEFSGEYDIPLVIYLPDGEELVFRPGTRIGFRWEQD